MMCNMDRDFVDNARFYRLTIVYSNRSWSDHVQTLKLAATIKLSYGLSESIQWRIHDGMDSGIWEMPHQLQTSLWWI